MKKIIFTLLLLNLISSIKAQELLFKTSDNVQLYVKIAGKGTPVLFLHGGPGSGSYWFEKIMGPDLEQNFQMIYLDQRGVGRSSSPVNRNFSMERMVMDFEELRTHLKIKQWITAGHSFGGILQMGYALQHPDAIKGMLMINTSLNFHQNYTDSWCPKACEFLCISDVNPYKEKSIPILERWGSLISQLNEKNLMWKMGFGTVENMDYINATYSEIENWNGDFGNYALEIQDYWSDFKKNTPQLKMPVLFFYGTKDWMMGPKHYKGVKFPNMLLYKSNVGHMPFLENKSDLLKAIKKYQVKYKL
ncbi:MAG: alpha/beta hydrolase [Bacteroidetes bacterium]|nr:alpha/beta hydrolase [Bacteroidota bacterium]